MISGAYANVLDFGAIGDGTTDDTAAIQAAITFLGAGGGVVYFPVGTYRISTTVSTPSSSNGIVLLGSGLRTTFLKWTGGASTMIFAHNGTDNFTMQGFALENTGTGTIAVQLNSVRCNIIDIFTNPTVAWSDTIFSTVSTIASYNYKVIFDNVNLFVSATGTAQADYAIKLGSGHTVTIQNSMFSGFAESAVFRDITVDTNVLNGLNITGTRFETFSGTAPNPGSINAIGINLQYSAGVSITGCNFEMAGDQIGSDNQYAIYIGVNVDGCAIYGNYFGAQGRCNYCVYVAANSADAVSIDANQFSRVVLAGVGAVSLLSLAKIQIGNNLAISGPAIIVENTFTPTLTIGGASTGITYSEQEGRFIRYGKNLTYQVSVTLTSKGALTGDVRIGALPMGANSALTLPNFVGSAWTLDLTAPIFVSSFMTNDGATSIRLYKDDGTELQNTDITNTSSFIVQVTVLTA
tara:strand:- start:300 stop:1694 length:1395 start_codon:yes stop_codon:yes gene_type:complete